MLTIQVCSTRVQAEALCASRPAPETGLTGRSASSAFDRAK